MSVTVRHLNADSTFLLTFSADPNLSTSKSATTLPNTYSVLIDPWLQGDSIVNHPWFAVTKHNVPAAIKHLSEIEEPDLVIVSQNKPDHCHGETLRQLRPEGKTLIAAEPGASKAIKSWNHFDPARVFGLPKYNPQKKFSLLRFHIPPLAPGGDPGEVTVAFLPAKNYVTGLHNAIGLTYQAPTAVKTLARVCTMDLPLRDYDNPFSPTTLPPLSPAVPLSPMVDRPRTADGSYQHLTDLDAQRASSQGTFSPDHSQSDALLRGRTGLLSPPFSPSSIPELPEVSLATRRRRSPTPPESPAISATSTTTTTTTPFDSPTLTETHTPSSSFSHPSKPAPLNLFPMHPARPRPLSVLYTPHGAPLSDLLPYAQYHLVPQSALPLTLLLHSFSRVNNPWYLGGNIMAGFSNGVTIARTLMAKVWLSAHDEDKDDQGLSVKMLKVEEKTSEDVRRMLYQDENKDVPTTRKRRGSGARDANRPVAKDGEKWRKNGWTCDVRDLGVGKSMVISAEERDLVNTAPKTFHTANIRAVLGSA